MAKNGFVLNKLSQLVPPETDWSLCIGAGASFPIFPSWPVLAKELAEYMHLHVPEEHHYDAYLTPEVIIQTVYELCERPETYADTLSEVLYANLFKSLNAEQKRLVTNCLTMTMPVKSLKWDRYINIIKDKGQTTSLKLGEYIADSIYKTQRPPKSILTFNAELLLPSLINAYACIKYDRHAKVLNYITEPTSSQYQGRINYYFCHGLVTVPGSNEVAKKNFNAKDKLVFAENEYLQLANSSFSWQSSSFMSTLLNSTVFFVGLSFMDPNVRRWLSWMHKCKVEAIQRFDPISAESTSHYWIEQYVDDENTRRWIEASVAHLGVRMIWVNEFGDVVSVLNKSIKK